MNFDLNIRTNLNRIVANRNISIEELSKISAISMATIRNNLCRGKISKENIKRYAEALEISPDDIEKFVVTEIQIPLFN